MAIPPGTTVKYWLWGLPYAGLDSDGAMKYWDWGLPYGYVYQEDETVGYISPMPTFRPRSW